MPKQAVRSSRGGLREEATDDQHGPVRRGVAQCAFTPIRDAPSRRATDAFDAEHVPERRRRASTRVDPTTHARFQHRRGRPGAQKREQVILPPLNEKIIQPLLRVVVDRGEADDEVLGIITRDEALERARKKVWIS